MSLEGENLGRWNLNYDPLVKFFLFPASTSSSDLLPWLLSPLRFLFFFLFLFFFFFSFFLQWLRTRKISPREVLNDEDFNFNVVEILHPVDRTPFYPQSLENFHSPLFFYRFSYFSSSFPQSRQVFRSILNIGFSLCSWHVKTSSNSTVEV